MNFFKKIKVKRELKEIEQQLEALKQIKFYEALILALPTEQLNVRVGYMDFVLEKHDKLKPVVDKILIEEINKQIENLKGKL
jgi:hypothetical protein